MLWTWGGAVLAAAAAHAIVIAPRRLRIVDFDVAIPGLDPAFDGYAIGVLSDLHQAPLPGLSHTRRAVEEIQRRSPDLIALLGDYATSFKRSRTLSARLYRAEMRRLTPLLSSLTAPDGVVSLLGNHDYYFDGDAVADWLAALGTRVLRNTHVEVTRGAARLTIAGVDDAIEGTVDARAAFAGADPAAPRVLLSHNPDAVYSLDNEARPALVLAGHTHGGQVSIPFFGPPVQFCRICTRHAAQGWIPNPYAPLFVSAGVGSHFPIRVGVTPDALLVRLRAPAAA